MKTISSTNNPEIKNIIKLRKAGARKKQGLFIIEGRHEISLALEVGVKVKSLYHSPDFSSDKNFKVDIGGAIQVDKQVFEKVSLRENPDGYLAVAEKQDDSLDKLRLNEESLVLVLEALEKPGNIGAILRTADAVQVDAVILLDPKTDIYNPNVIRSSLGTVFTNKIISCDFDVFIKWKKENKIKLFASTPDAKELYDEVNYSGKSAIIIGTEHEGISEKLLKVADKKIKLPMKGRIDSLNASVSAGVLLYNAIRQRENS